MTFVLDRYKKLLDAGELHQLLGELIGVERVQRVLVLQLRGEQLQEGPTPRKKQGLLLGKSMESLQLLVQKKHTITFLVGQHKSFYNFPLKALTNYSRSEFHRILTK